MPIRFRAESDRDHLHVVAEGSVYAVAEMVEYLERLHEALLRAGLSKLLVNETGCNIHLSLDQLRQAAEIGRGLNWR